MAVRGYAVGIWSLLPPHRAWPQAPSLAEPSHWIENVHFWLFFFPFHPEDRTRAFAHTGQVLCHLRDTFPSHRPSRRSCRAALGEASFRVMEARLCPA